MGTLANLGYTWAGIMGIRPNSPMDSVDKVKDYYVEKYGVPAEDIEVIENAAIYGGEKPTIAPGNVTIYVRKGGAK